MYRLRFIIPWLLSRMTGVPRYLPQNLDFNWRDNVTHALLMCYYALFWRRWGIRHGGITYYQDSSGRREVYIQTLFGALVFLEHEIIRPALRLELKWQEVQLLQPALAYGVFQAPKLKVPYLFAIGFANGYASTAVTSAPEITGVTPSGSDRILLSSLNYNSTVTTVPTFDSVASTEISTQVNTSDGNPFINTYRIVAPTASSGTLSAALSSSVFCAFLATTYTGIDQTTPTANETSNTGGPYAVGSPFDFTRTSNLDGSWIFASCKDDGAGPIAATAGVLRQGNDGTPNNALLDGDANVANTATGTITITWSGSTQRLGYQMCMLRPSAASAAGGRRRMMVGIGS